MAAKDAAAGWHFGVGRYRGDELAWFRLTSLRPGPTVVLDRTELEIVDRRPPGRRARPTRMPAGRVGAALPRRAAATWSWPWRPACSPGFLSWLESAPPGRTPGYRQVS